MKTTRETAIDNTVLLLRTWLRIHLDEAESRGAHMRHAVLTDLLDGFDETFPVETV